MRQHPSTVKALRTNHAPGSGLYKNCRLPLKTRLIQCAFTSGCTFAHVISSPLPVVSVGVTTASRVPWRHLLSASLLLAPVTSGHAQALYTASRAGDLQFGGNFSFAASHYLPVDTQGSPAPLSDLTRQVHLRGGGAYTSFDMRHHVGVELDFLRLGATDDTSTQTSFEAAGRYILFRGFHTVPYLRAGFGHGWYGYPQNLATVGYNLYGLGGGLDYHLTHSFNVRAAYEYQSWLGVPLKNPQPQVVSVGLAYRFHER